MGTNPTGRYVHWRRACERPGHFYNSHGLAIDPTNGDVGIGDREELRILIYRPMGYSRRPSRCGNLVCALHFDDEGNPWMGSGQDGQFLKLTRDGKVIGAVGNGMGIVTGQFIEASYLSLTSTTTSTPATRA